MIFLLLFAFIIDDAATIQPRSVNLALDTILEFNNKDNGDIEIIDNVQGFLNKIKHVLKDKSGRRSMNDDLTFTNFVIKFLEILKDYDDDDLEDAVAVIDDEMRKYHYGGCKFYELLQNNEMRRYIGHKLDSFRRKSPKEMRFDLETYLMVIKERKYVEVNKLFHYIDGMYSKKSRNKLRRFLSNMELYKSKSKRANLGLIKVIRDGIRSVIFDHYSNLNANARKDFSSKMKAFWTSFVNLFKGTHKVWYSMYTKDGNNERGDTNLKSSPIVKEFMDKTTTDAEEKETISTNAKPKLQVYEINTKPTVNSVDLDPLKEVGAEGTTENTTTSDNKYIFMKDLFSKITTKPKKVEEKFKNVFGSFKDDVTNRNIVKEFEKSIDLHIPDISKIVKAKFDSVTKEKILNSKNDILKDLRIEVEKDTTTKETTEKEIEWTTKKHSSKVKKHKTKDKKQKTPKRFSIVTTKKRIKKIKHYDTSEDNIPDESERYTTKKRKTKTTSKRKHKKNRNTRSRFITLYAEDYTEKAKKKKTRVTKKHRQNKSKKKLDRSRDKYKTKKVRDMTIGDYEDITDKTTRAKKYKGRHAKSSKHKKHKPKSGKKPSKHRKQTTKKSRKLMKFPTAEYFEGMSIESFETQRSFRKNIDFDSLTINQTTSTKFNYTTSTINNNITKTTSLPNTTETLTVLTVPTFGTLDFWPGTTNFPETASDTEIALNVTNRATENTTIDSAERNVTSNIVLRRVDLNTTEYKEIDNEINSTETKGNMNETLRFIDEHDAIDVIKTPAPNTTKLETTAKTTKVKPTVKTTKRTAKPKKPVKSKPKPVKRRNVVSTKTTKLTVTTKVINLNNTIPFDLGEFFNKSEIFNVEDGRKSFLRDKVFKDLQNVFSPTTSTRTTAIARKLSDPLDDFENALSIE